jgi:hypothetical protein
MTGRYQPSQTSLPILRAVFISHRCNFPTAKQSTLARSLGCSLELTSIKRRLFWKIPNFCRRQMIVIEIFLFFVCVIHSSGREWSNFSISQNSIKITKQIIDTQKNGFTGLANCSTLKKIPTKIVIKTFSSMHADELKMSIVGRVGIVH